MEQNPFLPPYQLKEEINVIVANLQTSHALPTAG